MYFYRIDQKCNFVSDILFLLYVFLPNESENLITEKSLSLKYFYFFHIKEVSVKTKFQSSQNDGHPSIHQWNQDLISGLVFFLLLHYGRIFKLKSKYHEVFYHSK